MNDRTKGMIRDREILEWVDQCKCLNTDQIELLAFPGMKAGKRKCQMRLKKLTDQRRLCRWRYGLDQPYAYYHSMNKPVEQMEHTVLLSWMFIWLLKTYLKIITS